MGSLVHWFIDSLNQWFPGSLVHWFTDLLISWFIDLLIHSVIDSSIHLLISSPVHWLIGSLNHRITELIHWISVSLIHRFIASLTEPLIHWFIASLVICLTDSLTHWFPGSLIYWFTDSLIQRFIGSLIHSFIQLCTDSFMSFHLHLDRHFLSRWCTSQLQPLMASASQNVPIDYRPVISYSHVLCSKLSPRRGPITIWYVQISTIYHILDISTCLCMCGGANTCKNNVHVNVSTISTCERVKILHMLTREDSYESSRVIRIWSVLVFVLKYWTLRSWTCDNWEGASDWADRADRADSAQTPRLLQLET